MQIKWQNTFLTYIELDLIEDALVGDVGGTGQITVLDLTGEPTGIPCAEAFHIQFI